MPLLRLLLSSSFLCLIAVRASAQDSRWGARVSIFQCQPIFSSEDLREGVSIAGTYSMPWNRMRFRSHQAELTIEGHFDISHSDGYSGRKTDVVTGFGVMALSRYRGRSGKGVAGYAEFGWGLYYSPRLSLDLDHHLSSSPTVGVGIVTKAPSGNEVYIGVRLIHLSNGGLAKRNQGQNRLTFTMGTKL